MALSVKAKSARKTFRSEFSSTTAEILRRIARGQSSRQIASAVGVSVGTVGTTRGNLTREFYYPYAYVNGDSVGGTCNFAG